jgi:hypothetical protein
MRLDRKLQAFTLELSPQGFKFCNSCLPFSVSSLHCPSFRVAGLVKETFGSVTCPFGRVPPPPL